MQEDPGIHPLRGKHPVIEVAEQRRRGSVALPIPCADPGTTLAVVASDTDRAVPPLTHIREPFRVDVGKSGRVRRHRQLMSGVARRDAPPDTRLQIVQPGPGQQIDLPRLQIPARGRAQRGAENSTQNSRRQRPIKEATDGPARTHRFVHIHNCPMLFA